MVLGEYSVSYPRAPQFPGAVFSDPPPTTSLLPGHLLDWHILRCRGSAEWAPWVWGPQSVFRALQAGSLCLRTGPLAHVSGDAFVYLGRGWVQFLLLCKPAGHSQNSPAPLLQAGYWIRQLLDFWAVGRTGWLWMKRSVYIYLAIKKHF